MANIPKGLGDVATLNSRIRNAEDRYNTWRSIHQEAYDYSMPDRETFRFHTPGQRKNRHVFDSTATLGVSQFASRIQGGIVPGWQQWMDYIAGSKIPKEERDEIDQGLKENTDVFFNHMNQSNFSTEITPTFHDLAIGTGAILIEEDTFAGDKILKFTNVPLSELYLDAMDGAWRKQEVEAGRLKQIWPDADLPDTLEKLVKKDPFSKVEIWNGMLFSPSDKLWHQIVYFKKDKHVLFTQSFKKKRLLVPRWDVTPGELYGRGPIIKMLPDIRTVNKVVEFTLQNAALQIAGVYTAVDDGVFNPHTVVIAPGSVIPVGSNANQNPTLTPITPSGNIQLGDLVAEQLRVNIRKALFSDALGDFQDPVRSATEMMIRQQEMLRTSGAQIARLNTELVEPLVAAVTEILQSRGVMAQFQINGEQVAMKPASPLAKAEALEDFQNTQIFMQALAGMMPFEAIAGAVKIEDLPKSIQEQLNVSPDLIRTREERDELAKQAIQASQQLGGQTEQAAEQPV